MSHKFNEGDRVIIKRTGMSATVKHVCAGNYFLPQWMCTWSYFVRINGAEGDVWFKQRQLKAYK